MSWKTVLDSEGLSRFLSIQTILWFCNLLNDHSLYSFTLIFSWEHCCLAAFSPPGDNGLFWLWHSFLHFPGLEVFQVASPRNRRWKNKRAAVLTALTACEERKFVQRFLRQRLCLVSEAPSRVRVATLIAHQVSFKGKHVSGLSKLSQKGPVRGNLMGISLFKCLEDSWQNHISCENVSGIYYLLSPQDKLWDLWWIFCNQMRE